jgi:hypothetical protein
MAVSQSPAPAAAQEPDALEPAPEATPFPKVADRFLKPWKGDLDGMIERRVIRVLTVQNPVLYFVDKGREVGGSPTRRSRRSRRSSTRSSATSW